MLKSLSGPYLCFLNGYTLCGYKVFLSGWGKPFFTVSCTHSRPPTSNENPMVCLRQEVWQAKVLPVGAGGEVERVSSRAAGPVHGNLQL